MVYPFLTLDDDTEFVHSEMKEDGRVRVDIERPDAEFCFKTATCWLPDYTWEDVVGFTASEIAQLQEVVESCAHLITKMQRTAVCHRLNAIMHNDRIRCIQYSEEEDVSTLTMRVDDVDAAIVRKYAKFEGKTISDFIRDAVFEKIEDQEDLATLRSAIAEDDGTRYSHEQVLAELGL